METSDPLSLETILFWPVLINSGFLARADQFFTPCISIVEIFSGCEKNLCLRPAHITPHFPSLFGVVTEPDYQLQERIITVPRPPPRTRGVEGADGSQHGIGGEGGAEEEYRDAAMYVVEQWGSMPTTLVRVVLPPWCAW